MKPRSATKGHSASISVFASFQSDTSFLGTGGIEQVRLMGLHSRLCPGSLNAGEHLKRGQLGRNLPRTQIKSIQFNSSTTNIYTNTVCLVSPEAFSGRLFPTQHKVSGLLKANAAKSQSSVADRLRVNQCLPTRNNVSSKVGVIWALPILICKIGFQLAAPVCLSLASPKGLVQG